MVATTEKKPVKAKEGSKKLPAVPESVLKHRKRREALRARRVTVRFYIIFIKIFTAGKVLWKFNCFPEKKECY